MPVNTKFIDARTTKLNPIPRVTCDLRHQGEREAFLKAIETAIMMQPPYGLIYIASIDISPSDREAAERIAWLRTNARKIGSRPNDQEIVGTLGEWALLRVLALDPSVKPVSLVSLAPESKPDFVVKYIGLEALFDIKTTASASEPSARIHPTLNEKKGTPHIIGICLRDELKKNPKSADVYFVNSKSLMTPAEYEKFCTPLGSRSTPSCSLKGYLLN